MKIIYIVVLVFAIVLLFGCTISVNPQDLAPSKNYLVVSDGNMGSSTNNSSLTSNSSGVVQKIVLNLQEVAKHSVRGNCWMVINNNVYDLSQYVAHPGGSGYLSYCGKEATSGYDTKGGRGIMHSSYADALLANYLIGPLGQEVTVKDTNAVQSPSSVGNQAPTQRPIRSNYYEDD
ncbi:MAG: cytochrome b5-like heme/steroid binding domain-containing protein [archaeon]|jgi:cytochrome b involved in lipid metabolism